MTDITARSTPRQTIPYADRPFVDPKSGRLTQEAYQFLQRLVGAGTATVENVGTVITQTNANSSSIAAMQFTVAAQGSLITNAQTQITGLSASTGAPPASAVLVSTFSLAPPAPSLPPVAGPPPPGRPLPSVLPSSLGGTDNSAAPQDGQLLIGNTAEGLFNLGTITPGSNITVTNAGGSITIAASSTITSGVATIVAGSGLSGGTITSTGTIALGALAADALLGNSGTAAATPTAVAIGPGLSLASSTLSATGISTIVAGAGLSGGTITGSGTIALATIAADALLGNVGAVGAVPTGVPIGAGLTVASGTLDALWNAGTVTALGPNLSLSGGTLSATGTVSGGVTVAADSLYGNPGTAAAVGTNIAIGANLSLSATGTLSATGGLGTIAADSLLGNSDTVAAVPTAIAIGANLTLASGTLSATSGGGGVQLYNIAAGIPALSSFNQVNMTGSVTVTEYAGKAISIQDSNAAAIALRGLSKAVAAAPYRVVALVQVTAPSANYYAIQWGFSDGTKFDVVATNWYSSGVLGGGSHSTWSNFSTRASNANAPLQISGLSAASPFWMGVRDDGTTVYLEVSPDGVNFLTMYSVAKSSGYLGSAGYTQAFFGWQNDVGIISSWTLRLYDPNGLTRTY